MKGLHLTLLVESKDFVARATKNGIVQLASAAERYQKLRYGRAHEILLSHWPAVAWGVIMNVTQFTDSQSMIYDYMYWATSSQFNSRCKCSCKRCCVVSFSPNLQSLEIYSICYNGNVNCIYNGNLPLNDDRPSLGNLVPLVDHFDANTSSWRRLKWYTRHSQSYFIL